MCGGACSCRTARLKQCLPTVLVHASSQAQDVEQWPPHTTAADGPLRAVLGPAPSTCIGSGWEVAISVLCSGNYDSSTDFSLF